MYIYKKKREEHKNVIERGVKVRVEYIGCYLTFRIRMYVLTCSTFFINNVRIRVR